MSWGPWIYCKICQILQNLKLASYLELCNSSLITNVKFCKAGKYISLQLSRICHTVYLIFTKVLCMNWWYSSEQCIRIPVWMQFTVLWYVFSMYVVTQLSTWCLYFSNSPIFASLVKTFKTFKKHLKLVQLTLSGTISPVKSSWGNAPS